MNSKGYLGGGYILSDSLFSFIIYYHVIKSFKCLLLKYGGVLKDMNPRKRIAALVAMFVAAAGIGCFLAIKNFGAPSGSLPIQHAYSKEAAGHDGVDKNKVNDSIDIVISFAGDCTLGEFVGQGDSGLVRDYFNQHGSKYFFSNVRQIFQADDLTLINLEGPFTNIPQQAKKEFSIRGDVRNVQALLDGSVEVCNLANNHILDCGEGGMEETEVILSKAGIAYCGGSQNSTIVERKGVKIAFLGYAFWENDDWIQEMIASDIKAVRSVGARIVICQFHWGVERQYIEDEIQVSLAHAAIDSGADMVVGAHPHVLQGVEHYKDKLICYSLGNFCFGANRNPSDKDSVIVQQVFHVKPQSVSCGPAKYIPCRISSVDSLNDYCPTPYVNAVDKARVCNKLRI